jgi:hypothetical protein
MAHLNKTDLSRLKMTELVEKVAKEHRREHFDLAI